MRITKQEGKAIDMMVLDSITNIIQDMTATELGNAEQTAKSVLLFLESIGYETGHNNICVNCGVTIVLGTARSYDGYSHANCNFPLL